MCFEQKQYFCTIMAKLDTVSFSFRGKDYLVASIPDIFLGGSKDVLIGPLSLNEALYDDDTGYVDERARYIDEQIYAYIDDDYLSLDIDIFLEKVQLYLD